MTLFLESRVSHRRTTLAVRVLAMLVALSYGWMAHANIVSTSHDPVRGSGHNSAQFLAAQPGGHGHSHDHSEIDDRSAGQQRTGHQNGHQATDHSHDKPGVSFSNFHAVTILPDVWSAAPQVPICPAPSFCIERPPKSASMF
jgi:hypothetical protein